MADISLAGVRMQTYVVVVASENALLQRLHVRAQEVEPLTFVANLLHVDVTRRNILVSAIKTRILKADGGSFRLSNLATNNEPYTTHN